MAKNKDRFRVAEKEIKGPYFEFSAYAKTELPPPPKKKKRFSVMTRKNVQLLKKLTPTMTSAQVVAQSMPSQTVLLSTILSGTIVLHRLMICLLLEFKPFTVKANKYIT